MIRDNVVSSIQFLIPGPSSRLMVHILIGHLAEGRIIECVPESLQSGFRQGIQNVFFVFIRIQGFHIFVYIIRKIEHGLLQLLIKSHIGVNRR